MKMGTSSASTAAGAGKVSVVDGATETTGAMTVAATSVTSEAEAMDKAAEMNLVWRLAVVTTNVVTTNVDGTTTSVTADDAKMTAGTTNVRGTTANATADEAGMSVVVGAKVGTTSVTEAMASAATRETTTMDAATTWAAQGTRNRRHNDGRNSGAAIAVKTLGRRREEGGKCVTEDKELQDAGDEGEGKGKKVG